MNELLQSVAESQGGIIKTSDAVAVGVTKDAFAAFIREQHYEKISHGIYLAPSAWPDEMYLLQQRCPKTVFSHETALYLLDLTDQEPMRLSVTAKTGYNPTHLSADGIKTFTIKRELFPVGVTQRKTPFGHQVNLYNAERTICDLIRSRNSLDPRCLQETLKRYVSGKEKDIPLLLEYADVFHVRKYLKPYLEALLS